MQDQDPAEEISVDKSVFKEWLEKLQQESWQLELLISGFAIFGIYSARPFLNELEISQALYFSDKTGFVIKSIVNILKNGWFIFFINLIVHVIFRGLWIGAIGLRYVSNEIEYDQLGYSKTFTDYLKNKVGSYDDYIERLEKLCSVIFAYTFLLFLFFFSFSLFITEVALLAFLLAPESGQINQFLSLVLFVFIFLGGLVFIDFISVGGFKKIKERSVSKVYFYIYWFYSTITLSILYRPLLYNFIDNKYTRKLFYFSIPYIIFILFGSSIFTNNPLPYLPSESQMSKYGIMIKDEHYDDRRVMMMNEFPNEDRKINRTRVPELTLEKFEVEGNIMSCFVLINKSFDVLFKHEEVGKPYYKDGLNTKLFGLHQHDDLDREKLREELTQNLVPKYAALRILKRKLRKDRSNESLKDSVELLETEISRGEDHMYRELEKYKEQRAKNALGLYLNYIDFEIDSVQMSKENCYFYHHPNFGEMGIKCFVGLDSITAGLHKFSMTKKYVKRDSVHQEKIVLPFIKTK